MSLLQNSKKRNFVISTNGRNLCFYYSERFLSSFGMTQKGTFARGSNDNVTNPMPEIRYATYNDHNDLVTVFSPIYGFTISNQALLTNRETNRLMIDLEVMPFGTPPPGNYARRPDGSILSGFPQTGIGLGYSYISDEDNSAHGPTLRFAFPLSRIDTTVSAFAAYRKYAGFEKEYWRLSPGVKLEMGFGLFFLNIGYAFEHYIAPSGNLENSHAFVSGISIVMPQSRILH